MRRCLIKGCERAAESRGWCNMHYMRWWSHGDPLAQVRSWFKAYLPPAPDGDGCRVDGCLLPRWKRGRGFCKMHYSRWYKHGDPSINLRPPIPTDLAKGSPTVCELAACGKEFIRRFNRARFCSSACANKRRLAPPKQCPQCGALFEDRYRHRKTFCSRSCWFASIGATPASERERNTWLNAHARKAGSERLERIDRQIVFDRDGWRCHICKGKIDKRKLAPHPKSASIDHLVPLSCGGAHTYDNVRAAHLGCNSRRSHTGQAQLIMFGKHHKVRVA